MENKIANTQNEILFVGAMYKSPENYVEFGRFMKSKYDFADDVTRFLYDSFEVIYTTRSETINEVVVSTFMSEDPARLNQYSKAGGWKTISSWMKLADNSNTKNYFNVIKKYSLLREYSKNGIDVTKLMSHKKFETLSPVEVHRLIRGKVDKINTVIAADEQEVVLNDGMQKFAQSFLARPDYGTPLPFAMLSNLFRGCKLGTTTSVGMLSNAGKTRMMVNIIAFLSLVQKQKCFVMLNEMSPDELKLCMLTTVINNKEYKSLHGVDIEKPEREISLGLYRNKAGEFIYRKANNEGVYTESEEDYIKRVAETSEEYRRVMKVAEWIELKTQQTVIVKDVVSDYSDQSLEYEMRKAQAIHGCSYVFYDTCKNDKSSNGDWAALKITVTHLSDVAKELNQFLYLSIQLTDDTIMLKPDELSSLNISACKSIKHVLYTLSLFKEVRQDEFGKYRYIQSDEEYGEAECELKVGNRYYVCNVDKNRFGEKKKLLFKVDLNKNVWTELGELKRK